MTETIHICKPLTWDSDFFRLKIASVSYCPPFDAQALQNVFAELKAERYDLVYLFVEGDEQPAGVLPDQYAATLVDRKYIFRTTDLSCTEYGSEVVPYEGPPQALFDLAFQAGEHSRYRMDRNFKTGTFERFYRTWIVNSVEHRIADYVFVYRSKDALSGFVTLKIQDGTASIGLIATDGALRGRGIGTELVNACKHMASRHGAQALTVATQKANVAACAFYIRCGMTLHAKSTVYHCWLNEKYR